MKQYKHRTLVKAPLERVAEFYADSSSLKRLTPPPIIVKFHEIQQIGDGSKTDFTMWFGPIPIRWVAIHSNVLPLNGFTDIQDSGPFQKWMHRHSFHSLDTDSTEIIDEIQAEYKNHPIWGLIGRFMWINLPILFGYRAWATRQALRN